AEDGIRDGHVTGVQTCALPICMGGESTEAWRAVLDDLIKRGLRRPEFLIADGAAGLENAIAAVWDGVPMQRCTVHKHRNLLAHRSEERRVGKEWRSRLWTGV